MRVTVWGTFQFVDVKTSLAGLTVPSDVSLLDSGTVTLAVGALLSWTVNVAVAPDSDVTRSSAPRTSSPGSLSRFVALTSSGSMPW